MESLPLSPPSLPNPNPNPKRGPGRPPKTSNPSPQPTSEAHQGPPNRPTRKRGRPARLQPPPSPVATSEKRRRGRPEQHPTVVPFASEPGPVSGRPRGRPRKGVAGSGMVVAGKRRGRPPQGISPRKPRRISGKPLGRPKKLATALRNPTIEHGQGVLNEELASKLELIQLKVREAVGIIRPYVVNEYAAIMALHQLEELMTTNTVEQPAMPLIPPHPVNLAVSPSQTQPTTVSEPGLAPGYPRPFFGVPGPLSVNLPALNVTGPFHVPSQQSMSWFPSGGTQS